VEGADPPQTLPARIRKAWELSRPPKHGASIQESASAAETAEEQGVRRLERIQEAIASTFYFGTFASIVVAVFFRFVLDRPLVWSIEVPTYLFFWCFCIASGLNDWRDNQISFDLISERLPARLRLAAAAVANVIIIIPFLVVIPGVVSYIQFEVDQPTTGLPFTEVWGYAGILPFFLIAILLRGRLLLKQLRALRGSVPMVRDRRSV